MINEASVLDTRKLMTGKDGKMFLLIDGEEPIFLAEFDQFTVNMNVTNVDVQPVGSILVYAVNSGVSYSITMSEMVVRDDVIMGPLLDAIAEGKMPTFNFQGACQRWDGEEQRMTFRRCTPDGEFNLMNLTPGEVIKRNMSFRINSIPGWDSKLKYE